MDGVGLTILLALLAAALLFVGFGIAGIVRLFRMGDKGLGTLAIVFLFIFAPVSWVLGIAAFFRPPFPGSPLYIKSASANRALADAYYPLLAEEYHASTGMVGESSSASRGELAWDEMPLSDDAETVLRERFPNNPEKRMKLRRETWHQIATSQDSGEDAAHR